MTSTAARCAVMSWNIALNIVWKGSQVGTDLHPDDHCRVDMLSFHAVSLLEYDVARYIIHSFTASNQSINQSLSFSYSEM